MADFCVFFGESGAGRGMDVLLRWLWEWLGLCNGRGKPAPLRKAKVIEQMQNHISTQMIAVRKVIGIVRSGGHGGVLWALLKHRCFTAGHHFNEC